MVLMMKNLVVGIILTVLLFGCASQVSLPSNVMTKHGAGGHVYIDRLDFSFEAKSQPSFSKLKLCVAENITNNDVSLNDSNGSFFGGYTGNYYRSSNVQAFAGKGLFKYVDDSLSTLIANGTAMSVSQQLIPITDIVKFELKSSVSGSSVVLEVFNITRAQKDTGVAANQGFSSVGAWSGARAPDIVLSLEGVANQIRRCVE